VCQVPSKLKVQIVLSFVILCVVPHLYLVSFLNIFTYYVVACHVGDWVEVQCDYTPGQCSEGGTGVVVAKIGGTALSQI
jgi:hypothetical protein